MPEWNHMPDARSRAPAGQQDAGWWRLLARTVSVELDRGDHDSDDRLGASGLLTLPDAQLFERQHPLRKALALAFRDVFTRCVEPYILRSRIARMGRRTHGGKAAEDCKQGQ